MTKLISLEDLKTYLEKNDTDHDELLTPLIDQVSARFETFTGRRFAAASRTETFDGGERLYYMDAFPIDTGEALTVSVDGSVKVLNTDYFVKATRGLIEFGAKTLNTEPNIVEITWTGGYPVAAGDGAVDVPDDLKGACLLQCAFQFKRRKEPGLTSVATPDGSINSFRPNVLLAEVVNVLKSYKVLRL
jgi:hypothetical protein